MYANREIEDLLWPLLKSDLSPMETLYILMPFSAITEDNNIQTLHRLSRKENVLNSLIDFLFVGF